MAWHFIHYFIYIIYNSNLINYHLTVTRVIVIGDVTRRRHTSHKAALRTRSPQLFFLPFPHYPSLFCRVYPPPATLPCPALDAVYVTRDLNRNTSSLVGYGAWQWSTGGLWQWFAMS